MGSSVHGDLPPHVSKTTPPTEAVFPVLWKNKKYKRKTIGGVLFSKNFSETENLVDCVNRSPSGTCIFFFLTVFAADLFLPEEGCMGLWTPGFANGK